MLGAVEEDVRVLVINDDDEDGLSSDESEVLDDAVSSSTVSATAEEARDKARNSRPRRKSTVHPNFIGSTRTMLNMFKAFVGVGILSLPLAFKQAGLWFGLFLLVSVGLLKTYCMHTLIRSANLLTKKSGRLHLDYAHLAKKSFDYGPLFLRRHSKKALYAVNIFIGILQVGMCSVQIVFIATSTEQVCRYFFPNYNLTQYQLLAILAVPVLLICLLRDLRFLALVSFLGILLTLLALCFIFFNWFQTYNTHGTSYSDCDYWFHSFTRFLVALGTFMYAIGGQSELLPMYNKMKNPQDMLRNGGVLQTVMAVSVLLFALTGFLGYAIYGSYTQETITLNMPHDILYQVVLVICLIISVFLGLGLHTYLTVAMLWMPVVRRMTDSQFEHRRTFEYLFRVLLMLVQWGLAMAVPRLDLILPLIGVVAGISLMLVFPPLLETCAFWEEWVVHAEDRPNWRMLAKNGLMIVLGLVGIVGGLYANINQAVIKLS